MSSGAISWLQSQRKYELVELAEKVGLKNIDNLKKSELEAVLDTHLRDNALRLSKENNLAVYYKRLNASPSKEVAVVDKETKTPVAKPRRKTVNKAEIDGDAAEGTSTAVSRTPKDKAASKLPFPANVPLPPSPAVIAEQVDRQIQRQSSRLRKAYKQSGIIEYVDDIRDRISTTVSIETLALIIELLGLRTELLPLKSLTTVPANKWVGTNEISIKVPDLFALLTATFWQTALLWFVTSVAVPHLASYLFNPTLKAKHGHVKHAKNVQHSAQYDPLTFNVVKALTVWLVFGQHVTVFGWPSDITKARIQGSVPGGYQGILVACGIGALTSLYEAVLKK